jgi:hypothetical protein
MTSEEPELLLEDLPYRYVIGIDLGTTNSALAYVDLNPQHGFPKDRSIRFFQIPQLVAPGEMAKRAVLPSFLYLPGPYELPPGSTALPWDRERNHVVGEFAREQGALVPGRLVSSAKSWLCHGGVDRTAPILPWGGADGVQKVSPVEASSRYLQHLREAWNEVAAEGREGYRLEEQLVILTVPASFDEVARELTVVAAREAGLARVVLLEEPLAAFYAWLSRHEADWQGEMEAGQLIWICDVGGGTTDFTVVGIREGEKGLRFDRLAVGEHLMLGGDNMDLTLGRHLERRLLGGAGRLEPKRWHHLCHQCRKAKETLLDPSGKGSSMDITVVGSGGKLIAGTLRGTLVEEEVRRLIIDGFFPFVPLDATPEGGPRTGLTEWGLPYVKDPAVTRHMAAFWRRFQGLIAEETGREIPYPDFLLFNGGALAPASITERLTEVVQGWFQETAGKGWAPEELDNPHPELAVAVGAAYYGLVRLGEGVRVGAGSPRSFYVEVGMGEAETKENRRHAVCLVPRGTEEGSEMTLETPAFEVLANQPAAFQLMSSSTRLGDRLGDIVELDEEELTIFPPIHTVLRYGKKGLARRLPVQLAAKLTEVGTLELWCRSQQSRHQWQLQFDVRREGEPGPAFEDAGETLERAAIEGASEKIRSAFEGAEGLKRPPAERLVKDLEELLEVHKEEWATPVIRELADSLFEVEKGRRLTPQHEARWFNLLGFCLRPGFGDPLDEWRMKEVWKVYLQGLHFPRQVSGRTEFWIFLRRVAGGLNAGRQWHVYQQVLPYLQPDGTRKTKAGKFPKRMNAQETLELWMAMANFERLPAEAKVELGRVLLQRVSRKTKPQELWALSRFGARSLFYGPLDRVIPREEATSWLESLLSSDLSPREAVGRALVQLSRLTGDRERDVSEQMRKKVAQWLEQLPGENHLLDALFQAEGVLSQQEKDWVFGESLPTGLLLSPA